MPQIREHWRRMFESFSVTVTLDLKPPLSAEQTAGVNEAVNRAVNQVADRLKRERATAFGTIAALIYDNTELQRRR